MRSPTPIREDYPPEGYPLGAAKREERWQDRVSATRQELAAHTDLAAERLRAILENGKDADALRAAIALLDRIGAGPHSVQDVTVSPSLVEQWAAEIDAKNAEGDLGS